jgi:hypothetical protein
MPSETAVDLALVLAVDCSSSVDAGDYRLQMDGIAAALRNPPLAAAIAAGVHRKIALTLVHWSSRKSQSVVMPWRMVATLADLESVAWDVEKTERKWLPGGTALAAGVNFSVALLETLEVTATRRVIDVSGDGEDNDGGNAGLVRDAAVARGITINGLPILYGSNRIEAYYRAQVIGGPGAFLIPTATMQSFKEAMTRKLLREVSALTV